MLLAVAIIGFCPFHTIHDDGLWPVSVTIRSESGRKIVAASAEAMNPGESADYILKHLAPPEVMICAAQQDPFAGDPLKVPVVANETIRGCLFWNYRRFFQYTKMVVIVRFDDGNREGRMVDIPDLHKSRAVEAVFP